ncbi:MAG: V-type ATP synthase subunit E family protein [Gemmatimonadales bacterium]
MAIDDLLRHLEREAEERAAGILAEAEREARDAADRAALDRERRRRAALARLDAELASEIRRGLARVEREARRRALVARSGVVDRIIELAAMRLEELPVARYRERLASLVAETLAYLEHTPTRLLCREDARQAVVALVDRTAGATIDPAPGAAAGLIGCSMDGRVTVDNTLVARLRRDKAELAIALTAKLDRSPDVAR